MVKCSMISVFSVFRYSQNIALFTGSMPKPPDINNKYTTTIVHNEKRRISQRYTVFFLQYIIIRKMLINHAVSARGVLSYETIFPASEISGTKFSNINTSNESLAFSISS